MKPPAIPRLPCAPPRLPKTSRMPPLQASGRLPSTSAARARRLGSKVQEMVFSGDVSARRSVRTKDLPAAECDRFSLSDGDVLELARTACLIEKQYGRPMDIEWGKDGLDGRIHVLQARPE